MRESGSVSETLMIGIKPETGAGNMRRRHEEEWAEPEERQQSCDVILSLFCFHLQTDVSTKTKMKAAVDMEACRGAL